MDGINIYRLSYIKNRDVIGFWSMFKEVGWFLGKRVNQYDFCIIRTLTFHCLVMGLFKLLGLKLKTIVTAEIGGKDDDIMALKKSKFWKVYVFLVGKHNYLNSLCDDNFRHYRNLGFDMKKVTRIGNGIDTTGYKKSRYPTQVSNFLFLGRLVRTKGIFELVEAFILALKKRPEIKLYIGGDGPDRDLLLKKIKLYKKNIIYLGYIKRENREKFYKKGDCFILPSYSESFSLVVYEAAVRKKYIISTDVADLKKVFGNNILFCRKRDYRDLAQKIVDLGDNYQDITMNYNNVVEKVDISKVATTYINLFAGFGC